MEPLVGTIGLGTAGVSPSVGKEMWVSVTQQGLGAFRHSF